MATPEQIQAIAGLYVAYFDRAADPAGLQFWIDQLDNGRDFSTISQDFADSPEAKSIYPFLATPDLGALDPTNLVTSIYQNMFGREPEAAGLSFWVEVVNSGAVAVGDMVEAIMMGAQDAVVDGQLVFDKTIIENRIECSLEFAVQTGAIPGFEFDDQAYNTARAVIEDVDQTQESVNAAKVILNDYLEIQSVDGGSVHLLESQKILVSEATETPVFETIVYWGYNPHGHGEEGVDNTAEPNTNNLTNEGPADGGIPATTFFDRYLPTMLNTGWGDLYTLLGDNDDNVDPDAEWWDPDFNSLEDIQIGDNSTLTFNYADGTSDDVAIAEEYFDFICKLIFDAEGNTRFFEKQVAAQVTVYVTDDGEVTLDSVGNDSIGTIDAILSEDATYMTVAPILTPTYSNGGSFGEGLPDGGESIDDVFVASHVELLHTAILDGGLGYNTLEIDAKGHFAQPRSLINIQQITIESLPNIYTSDEDGYPTTYPDPIADNEDDSVGSDYTTIDLTRATDLENVTITESNYDYTDLDETYSDGMAVVGLRNGASLTLEGDFYADLYVQTSEGGPVDGFTIILNNVSADNYMAITDHATQINIESNGGGNYLQGLYEYNDSNVSEIYISGDAPLFIQDGLDYITEDDTPLLIDASANKGGVDLNIGDGAEQITFVGSQADDRFAAYTDDQDDTGQGPNFDNDQSIAITNEAGDNYYDVYTYDLSVTDGDGDINVEFDTILGNITLGDGDNHVEGYGVNVTAAVGDGDNRFDVRGYDSPETTVWAFEDDFPTLVDLTAGDGSNIFNVFIDEDTAGPAGAGHFLAAAEVNITAGDGGNLIQIPALPFDDEGVLSTVTVNTGGGDDTMVIGGSTITVNSGGGNDEITLLGIDDDYVTEVSSEVGAGYNYKGFIPSIYGAEINIDTGAGSAQINLGSYLDDAFLITGALVAKEGSSITGSDITLFVNTDADLRAATLDGITAIVMDDDNRQYSGQGFSDGDDDASGAASLTLLDSQVAQLLADGVDFSTQGETFGAQSVLTIVITGDVVLSDLIDLTSWNDSVKLCFVVEDGASLTMTAEELHTYVAPQGIAVDEENGYIDNQITITNAGPGFNAYGDQNDGTGGGTIAGGTPMQDVTVLFTEEGFERPEQDDPINLIQWNSDEDAVIEVTKYPFATDLEITGAADISVENPIFLGEGFTIDFSDFGGDFVQMVNGVPTLTVANFNNLTPDVNDGPGGNIPNDGDLEAGFEPDPSTWGNIQGNGTEADPVRINMLVENGTSTGDCDLGVTEGGFLSSGVQQFVLTGFHDDDMDLLAQSGAWTADIVVCDQTEDLEVLGLQNNRNASVTFWQVNWGTEILLEGDGYANSSDQEKNLGDPDFSEVGKVTANFFEPGANAFVRLNNQGVELGLNEDAEDGFDPDGERVLEAAGIVLNNADRLLLQVEDGDAVVNDVSGHDLERIIVTGPEDVTINVASITEQAETDGGKDGFIGMMAGLDAGDLVSIDASGVVGTFTMVLGGDADLSGVDLTGVDVICVDVETTATLTMTADQLVALGVDNLIVKDGAVTLNVDDMGDQPLALSGFVDTTAPGTLDVGTVTFVDEAVTVNAATDFGDADTLVIPEDSEVTMTVAQFMTADGGDDGQPDVTDGDGDTQTTPNTAGDDVAGAGTNADDNKLILTDVPNGEPMGATAVTEVNLTDVSEHVDVDIVFDNFVANDNFDVSAMGGETTTAVISGTTDLSAGALGTVDCVVLQDGAVLTLSQDQVQDLLDAALLIDATAELSDVIKLADGATATLNINEIDGTGTALDLNELVDDWAGALDIGTLTIENTDANVTLPNWTTGGADEIVTPTADMDSPEFGTESTSLTLTMSQFLDLDGIGFISGDGEVNLIDVADNNDGPDAGLDPDTLLIDTSGITAPKGTLNLLEEGVSITAVGETVTLNEASDVSGFEIILTDGQLFRFATEDQASGAAVTEDVTSSANPTGIVWLFETVSAPVDTSNYDADINTLFVSEILVNGANEEELWTTLPSPIVVEKFGGSAPLGLVVFERINTFEPFTAAPDGITFDDQSENQTTGALTLNLEGNVMIGDVTVDDTVGDARFEALTINSYFDAENLPDGYGLDQNGDGVVDELDGVILQPNEVGDIFLNADKAPDTPTSVTLNTSDGQNDAPIANGTTGAGSGPDTDDGLPLSVGTIHFGAPAADVNSAEIDVNGDHDVTIGGIDMSDPALTIVSVNLNGGTALGGAGVDLVIDGVNYGDLAENMGLTAADDLADMNFIHFLDGHTAGENDDLGLPGAQPENILVLVGGDNDLTAMSSTAPNNGVSMNTGVYVTGPATLKLTADQLETIGITDADMDGTADNWVLGPGVNPGDVTIDICELDSTNGTLDLDAIQAAGFNIGTITLVDTGMDTYVDLDNGTTLGGADQIVMELDFFDISLELSAEQYQGFSGIIVEDRSEDALTDATIVGTVIIDELESSEDTTTAEVTIDVTGVATTGPNTFFLQDANNETNANDPTDAGGGAGTDTDYSGVAPENDTTFSAASNLGTFSVSLYDVDSTGAADELAGQTVRFSTEEQADGRAVVVLDPDGANPNKDEHDTNVVWLFDTVSGGLNVSDYDANLGRIWISDDLVDSVSGDVDGLFTIPNPDNPGEPLFTLDPNIIKRIETEDLTALLQLNQNINQRVEITSFTTIAGAEFEVDDPLQSIFTLRIDMGGATNINDLEIDNILGPVNPDNPNFPGDDDFAELILNSFIANNPDHYLLPDSWTDAIPLPNDDLQVVNQANVIGDISSGENRGVLHTITINTGFADPSPDVNVDPDGAGPLVDDSIAGEGTDLIANEVFISDDGDTTMDGGTPGNPDGLLTLIGQNDVTFKSLDTSDVDIITMTVDTAGHTGTFTVTGGSPAFDGDGTGTGQGDTTTDLTFTNGLSTAGVVQFASTVTFDDATTMDDVLTPQEENNEANIEYNVGSGETLPYAGVSSGALENIDATDHGGTISLGVISQVNSESFTLNAGATGQVFGCLGEALDDGVAETPSLSATGTWNFTGAAGGDPAFGGVNNLDLEIKDVDIAAGGTMNFTNVDVCISGDVDLTGANITMVGSTIVVKDGAKLTLTVEQVDALETAGVLIAGAGTVCVTGESDDSDIGTDTTFSNLLVAEVDLSAVTLAASDVSMNVAINVNGAFMDNSGVLVQAFDDAGDRVAQTIIGTDENDFVIINASADDTDDETLDVILQMGDDDGALNDVTDLTDDDAGDTAINLGTANFLVESDEGADLAVLISNDGDDADAVQVGASGEFNGVTNGFVATADSSNDGVALIQATGTDVLVDMSAAGGANGWNIMGSLELLDSMDTLIGSDQNDVIIDGVAADDDNDLSEDTHTGGTGDDTFEFNVASSVVASVTDNAPRVQAFDFSDVIVSYGDAANDPADELRVEVRIGNSLSTSVLVNQTTAPGTDFTMPTSVATGIATALNGQSDISAFVDPGNPARVLAYGENGLSFNFIGITANNPATTAPGGGDFVFSDLPDGVFTDDTADVNDDDRGIVSSTLSGTIDPGEVYTATVTRGDGTALTVSYTAMPADTAQMVVDSLVVALNGGDGFGSFIASSATITNGALAAPEAAGELVIFDIDPDNGGNTLAISAVSTVTGLSGSSILDGTEATVADADADVITDFMSGSDKIDIQALDDGGVDQLTAGSAINYREGAEEANFMAAQTAANGQLDGTVTYYLTSSAAAGEEGLLFYDANGDGSADGVIHLVGIDSGNFDDNDIM